MYSSIFECRICGNKNLTHIFNLGIQEFTGVFPKTVDEKVPKGPLSLVKCHGSTDEACGLVQLGHFFDKNVLYGDTYGYLSGLNASMVKHLKTIVDTSQKFVQLKKNDLIIDIGSNDGTLLNFFSPDKLNLIGIDPTALKFKKNYKKGIHIFSDFFPSQQFKKKFGNKKAKIIYSIAMFYDLDQPYDFVKEIYESLEEKGIWVLEQSYLPVMLDQLAYDTICHEHLEYYGLKQIKWIFDRVGLKIININFNDTNGGSFQIIAAKHKHPFPEIKKTIKKVLTSEKKQGIHSLERYKKFEKKIKKHKDALIDLIHKLKKENKKIFGYGASTKGNVLLQYCNFGPKDIAYIADVNKDKYGSWTPGTHIPIIPEEQALEMQPDYFLVLPWHFKKNVLQRQKKFINSGGKLIFPLPNLLII